MSPDRNAVDHKETRTVGVTIFGHPYSLRTDEDPAYVESLAASLDRRMREVADRTRTADTLKIAILAALNITDELHQHSPEAATDLEKRAGRIEKRRTSHSGDEPGSGLMTRSGRRIPS